MALPLVGLRLRQTQSCKTGVKRKKPGKIFKELTRYIQAYAG
jgi:hypothetical protein